MSTSSPFLPSSVKLNLEGVLLIDKPIGCTSHDVVDRVRRKLGIRQVGHAGTLDPLATGLLILLIGKATKLSQYLISLDKTYEGTLKLGETTDTYDREGSVLVTMPVPSITEADLKVEMQSFVKDQYQLPPMFSAKKVGGTPLYKMARKGLVIEREPRFISIYEFQLTQLELPYISFLLRCSKGTYVRTVAHDLGAKIGCGAHLTNLRRTTSGKFQLEQALTLEAFEQGSLSFIKSHLISAAQAVPVGGIIN
jgi:tRNA pseudouridine55 synthase